MAFIYVHLIRATLQFFSSSSGNVRMMTQPAILATPLFVTVETDEVEGGVL